MSKISVIAKLTAATEAPPGETPLWASLRGAGVVAWLRVTSGERQRAAALIDAATEGTAAGPAPALAWLSAAVHHALWQGEGAARGAAGLGQRRRAR